jgi:methyl-accepting chemotaxis protein
MIEKSFESKFFLKYIVSIIASFGIILIALYLVLPRNEVLQYYEAISSFIKTSDALVKTFVIAGLIDFAFIILLITIISILASHKIAGPIYRLEKKLENFADGDLAGKVYFRQYDPLKNVANTFNNTLGEITQRIKAIDDAADSTNKAREKLDGSAKSIEAFRDRIIALENEIEKFKL